MKKIRYIIIALILGVCAAQAAIELPAIYSDGMVLQQKQPVPVWGWADAGTPVTVMFDGQTQSTKANADGKWMLTLDALNASSKSREMVITVGDETQTIRDVLVGEVWFCSGQSNMDYTLQGISKEAQEERYRPASTYVKNEMTSATDPLFRQITVARHPSVLQLQDKMEGTWVSSHPQHNATFTATGYFFGRELRKELKVPVGLIKCAWGGTRVEPWIPETGYRTDPSMAEYYDLMLSETKQKIAAYDPAKAEARYRAALKEWKEKGVKKKRPKKPRSPTANQQLAGTLYNGMVNPVVPYGIKGVIWYQGESNQGYLPEKYELHFSTLIKSWRSVWKQGDFPFYFVQLANHKQPNQEPLDEDPWASIQDIQRRTLKVKNTGMAIINDIGETSDIHPRNKVDVGKRLALLALAKDYGHDLAACSGPLYQSHAIEGDKVIVTFEQVGSGLMTGHKEVLHPTVETQAPLTRFQICGADRQWVWANAQIISPNQVQVSHPTISTPTIVRYAWSSNPAGANLYNKEGLPASIFTTE